ncbi:MAG: DUF692 domain-containing protein [Cellvibrio sp.]|uniref:DUF692 domain-containing protein n=1 Tax=Cellvibrio sp. TaxID=1965322 RepID=UPI00271AD52B|nr:DUF692 domain-containing protein [Cellvibrio sp.]
MTTYSQLPGRRLSPHAVGVGLRSPHYQAALDMETLTTSLLPDFVEVHAENFFAKGGLSASLLGDARKKYALSIHGTGLGLGSYAGLSVKHLAHIKHLNEQYDPSLFSDHAAFSIANISGQEIHSGDLLPVELTEKSIATFEANINQVQDALGRIILLENICTYVPVSLLSTQSNVYSEPEFLAEICKRTGCGLLIDLNNLVVNAVNEQEKRIDHYTYNWLSQIPPTYVGEYHLAGCALVKPGEIMVDDHSEEISQPVWDAYEQALTLIGPRPTLLEWDTQLPSWERLLLEASKIRGFAQQALHHE